MGGRENEGAMTGIAGGTVDTTGLDELVDALNPTDRHETERFAAGAYGIGATHHGSRDPESHAFWTDGQAAGAIDGAVTNLGELGWDVATVFERLRRAPERTLAALEGPFTVAVVDAADDRALLATDKIGSRPPLFSTENGFHFASGLAPFVAALDEPTVDPQGVSDLLLVGGMWSDTTLLEGVRSLHPATLVEYRDGAVTERRYWHPDYEPARPTDEYFHDLVTAFRRTVDRTASSVSGDAGLWLSGGLDSRATCSELARNYREGPACQTVGGAGAPVADPGGRTDGGTAMASLSAYTYDANPGGGVNPRLAGEVADALELPLERVELAPETVLPVLEEAVLATDGMVKWNTLLNLTATFAIEGTPPDVMMEGVVGELVGQHLSRAHLTEPSSLVESMYRSEASLAAADVEDLLAVEADPMGSFRKEARRIDEPTFAASVVDAHFQNYYPRFVHASNPVPRLATGTRVPYADGDFLETAAKLPLSYRMGTLPVGDGLIHGVVKSKVRLMRALDTDLAEIPYERSRLKPTRPFPLHVAGFFASTALGQLRGQPTYGGRSTAGEWYREHDAFRARIDGLVDDATERRFFDADAIEERRERHLAREGEEMDALSAVTTFEIWAREHLD